MDMTRRPIYHAILASAYIVSLVSGAFFAAPFTGARETIFIPMGVLSLLVLSVALMAYLFFGEPLRLLIEGQAEKAVRFLFTTLGTFAILTAILLSIAFGLSFT